MGHCRGGTATELFDPLAALQAWVEEGKPPARLTARAVPGGLLDPDRHGLSRPLCAWPRYARWDGSGPPALADSFVCTAP
jgi:feruloyl esterase